VAHQRLEKCVAANDPRNALFHPRAASPA
jgi:hypothetical protein